MFDYYILVFKRWLDFRGRSRRSEYWYFSLANFIVSILLSVIESVVGIDGEGFGGGALSGIYSLVTLVPGLSVSFRRLHDVGKSAWWLLLVLIPILGWIPLLIWCIRDSDENRNEYGPNPKFPDDDVAATFN
jgi:uncharacterized membrane protein YhaH (DUF805 family)